MGAGTFVSLVALGLVACGSTSAEREPVRAGAGHEAPVAAEPEPEPEVEPGPRAGEPATAEPEEPATPAPSSDPEPPGLRGGPGNDPHDDPSCGEEAERACYDRGGNCRLVLDSPCVGSGALCQDEHLQITGCRCYCEPVDGQGRPILPR